MSKIREGCRIAFSLWKHSGLQMIWLLSLLREAELP